MPREALDLADLVDPAEAPRPPSGRDPAEPERFFAPEDVREALGLLEPCDPRDFRGAPDSEGCNDPEREPERSVAELERCEYTPSGSGLRFAGTSRARPSPRPSISRPMVATDDVRDALEDPPRAEDFFGPEAFRLFAGVADDPLRGVDPERFEFREPALAEVFRPLDALDGARSLFSELEAPP